MNQREQTLITSQMIMKRNSNAEYIKMDRPCQWILRQRTIHHKVQDWASMYMQHEDLR